MTGKDLSPYMRLHTSMRTPAAFSLFSDMVIPKNTDNCNTFFDINNSMIQCDHQIYDRVTGPLQTNYTQVRRSVNKNIQSPRPEDLRALHCLLTLRDSNLLYSCFNLMICFNLIL